MLHDFTREIGVELPDDISASSEEDIALHKTSREKVNLVEYSKDSPMHKGLSKTLDIGIILATFCSSLFGQKDFAARLPKAL